jgi:hypothetical protein
VSKESKATQKSLIGDLKPSPGVKKVDPILVADGVSKRYGGLQAIDVAHVEIPRKRDCCPNRSKRSRKDNLVQYPHWI